MARRSAIVEAKLVVEPMASPSTVTPVRRRPLASVPTSCIIRSRPRGGIREENVVGGCNVLGLIVGEDLRRVDITERVDVDEEEEDEDDLRLVLDVAEEDVEEDEVGFVFTVVCGGAE